jgi:hypothetical protein
MNVKVIELHRENELIIDELIIKSEKEKPGNSGP